MNNRVCDTFGNLNEDKRRTVVAFAQVQMFEIKLAQGANQGRGCILPDPKVTAEIAKTLGLASRRGPEGCLWTEIAYPIGCQWKT